MHYLNHISAEEEHYRDEVSREDYLREAYGSSVPDPRAEEYGSYLWQCEEDGVEPDSEEEYFRKLEERTFAEPPVVESSDDDIPF